MSLAAPVGIFGIHSVTPYRLDTGMPFGMLRVLGQVNIANEVETIDLKGGSSRDPWASELGMRTSEVSVTFREYPSFLFELLAGIAATDSSAETGGGVTTLTNVYGSTAKSATIGIASVGVKVGSEIDVKYGVYVVKVVSATTVDVYCMSDVDFAQGASLDFTNDALKITASALTIAMGAAVTIPSFGLELTGGSGTIGMTTGHTAVFVARPINTGRSTAAVGTKEERFAPFGAIIVAQRQSDGKMFKFNFYKLLAAGLPANMAEMAWSEFEVKLKPVRAVPIISLTGATAEGLYEYQTVKETAS